MRVVIDYGLCEGHGRCAMLAPQVFDLDEEGRGMVRFDQVPAEFEDDARLAVDNCPESAISVSDWERG